MNTLAARLSRIEAKNPAAESVRRVLRFIVRNDAEERAALREAKEQAGDALVILRRIVSPRRSDMESVAER